MKAIIVGATSGIGKEVAKQLANAGWELGIAGRRVELLEQLQQELPQVKATRKIDITQEDAGVQFNSLAKELVGVDLYFHSSGIGWQNLSLETDKELSTVETNALGFTRMMDAAFAYFTEKGGGHIAAISSIAGTKGLGAAPAYSATKRYQRHYIDCLDQLSRMRKLNIRFTDIRPGFVATALIEGSNFPLKLNATDVAKLIVKGVLHKKRVLTLDWRYRILVFFWQLIPNWIWVRMPIKG